MYRMECDVGVWDCGRGLGSVRVLARCDWIGIYEYLTVCRTGISSFH